MGDVLSLSARRKAVARAEAEARAAENRVRHGRTGAEKAADRAEAARRERAHAGAVLEPGDRKRRDP